jgi:type I restriction enzyme S subunit
LSGIDELIAELCPDGVEFRPLSDLVDYRQPTRYLVESTAYDPSFTTPVLTAGQTFILGYTNETDGIYAASVDEPVVIFDDFTTAFKWVDFPFKAKSSAMKILTLRPGAPAILRYVYYAMLCVKFVPQSHARQWIGTYSNFRVPVPPFEVQREVVSLLDQFQELEAELEVELNREISARGRQFIRHRDSVLNFADRRLCKGLSIRW